MAKAFFWSCVSRVQAGMATTIVVSSSAMGSIYVVTV